MTTMHKGKQVGELVCCSSWYKLLRHLTESSSHTLPSYLHVPPPHPSSIWQDPWRTSVGKQRAKGRKAGADVQTVADPYIHSGWSEVCPILLGNSISNSFWARKPFSCWEHTQPCHGSELQQPHLCQIWPHILTQIYSLLQLQDTKLLHIPKNTNTTR